MSIRSGSEVVIDLSSEQLSVSKQEVVTGRVSISISTETQGSEVSETLVSETADVERVPVGRFVEVVPQSRQEGDVLVIPLVEERMVKRLFLREELRISKRFDTTLVTATADLRREEAVIERLSPLTSNPNE